MRRKKKIPMAFLDDTGMPLTLEACLEKDRHASRGGRMRCRISSRWQSPMGKEEGLTG